MSPDADTTDDPAHELDVDRVARLANLPIDEEERNELADACASVLDAFALEQEAEVEQTAEHVRLREDELAPWPEEGIDGILDAMPERDGRHMRV